MSNGKIKYGKIEASWKNGNSYWTQKEICDNWLSFENVLTMDKNWKGTIKWLHEGKGH